MAIQTDIHYEVTDLFGGETNYSWVKRGVIECKPGENYSDLTAVRRGKKALGWENVRCKKNDLFDMIELRPADSQTICFIEFREHGSAS